MIIEIKSINNVGRFQQFNNAIGMKFDQCNIIYGENGQGKTTLAHILRSLATGEPKYITERRAVGTSIEPSVIINLDSHTANYSNQSWDTPFPQIEIFDTTYVNENLFSGYYVDLDQKRKLYRFVVGDEGVLLSAKVDGLAERIQELNIERQGYEAKIRMLIKGNIPLEDFVGLVQIENLDTRIKENTARIAALDEREKIAKKELLEPINLPHFPKTKFIEILSRQISNISAVTMKRMQTHIDHYMDKDGEKWISQGRAYVKDDLCPFCGQLLNANELIQLYDVYFGETYNELKIEIGEFHQLLRKQFSHETMQQLTTIVGLNNTLSEFWSDHIEIQYPQVDLPSIDHKYMRLVNVFGEYLVQKTSTPLEAIDVNTQGIETISDYVHLLETIEEYNRKVDETNKKIVEQKRLTEMSSLEEAQKVAILLENTKTRFQSTTVELCDQFKNVINEKTKAEVEKVETKTKLDEYTASIFERYEQKLNEYLEKFMTGFRIQKDRRPKYSGGKASISYSIVIKGVEIALGTIETTGEPSFATSLSEGDKNTFAFAYFMAKLDMMGEAELKNKIVIIDDPISSLDMHRRSRTYEEVNRITKIAKQVIILSHDSYFLKNIWDGSTRPKPSCFKISHDNSSNSSLIEWDVHKETQSDYFTSYEKRANYLKNGAKTDGERREIAGRIRLLVEGYYKIQFPNKYDFTKPLGVFIGTVSNSKLTEPLYALYPLLSDMKAINAYSLKFHHDENPGAATEPISDIELVGFVRRAFKLIYGYY